MIKFLTIGLMAGALMFAPVQANSTTETSVVVSTEETTSETEQPIVEVKEVVRTAKLYYSGDWLTLTFYNDNTCTATLNDEVVEGTLVYKVENGVYTLYNGEESVQFTINDDNIMEEYIEDEEHFDFGEWMEKYFTAEMIATVMSVLTSLAVVLKLASSMKELAKKKAITTEEVCAKVVETLETTNKESVNKSINELIAPLQKQVGDITPVLNSFAKILALSQENTPESRLAILELIQSIGNVSAKIVENAKAEVENQIKEEQKDKQDTIELLENIEDKNTSSKNVEGRY